MTDQDSNVPADVAEEVVVAPADATIAEAEVAVEVAPEEVAAPTDAEVSTTEVTA
ncbi:MAG: hypothetical protein QG568_27 [Patescibacteria group bacterium]|nr:hypothetical protein [Patescibacteria group bacterium]